MIRGTTDIVLSQERRLKAKTQDQHMVNLAVQGAGISPWEAGVLVEMIQEVYFAEPKNRPLRSGQMRYECVAAHEGAGKPIAECQMVSVVLTIHAQDDGRVNVADGKMQLRQRIIQNNIVLTTVSNPDAVIEGSDETNISNNLDDEALADGLFAYQAGGTWALTGATGTPGPDANGDPLTDYHLDADNLNAIGQGVSGDLTVDYFGDTRPDPPSIGALEAGELLPTPTPRPPTTGIEDWSLFE